IRPALTERCRRRHSRFWDCSRCFEGRSASGHSSSGSPCCGRRRRSTMSSPRRASFWRAGTGEGGGRARGHHPPPSPARVPMGGFLLLYYANYVVLLGRRGVGYLVHDAVQPFFVSPLERFGADLFTLYLAATTLALVGLLLGSRRMPALLYVTMALVALRCTARVSGGYYTLFFAPLLACWVAVLFAQLLEKGRSTRRTAVAALM